MKKLTATALVALMAAGIGLPATTAAMAQPAQDAPAAAQPEHPAGQPAPNNWRDNGPGAERGPGPGHQRGDLLNFDRGAEAIEIALVRLSHRIDLTAEQQTLLDTLKTAALSAAEDVSATAEQMRPDAPAEGEAPAMPDLSERLQNRIVLETARLAALEAVEPSFTAFFDSLTDEQKAQLMPQRGDGEGQHPRGQFGPQHGGPGGRH